MKQKAFLSPVWMMLIIGFVNILLNFFTIYYLGARVYKGNIAHLVTVFFFLWPALFFSEAYVYWVIRKRIERTSLAWAHVLLTFFAVVILRLLIMLKAILHSGGISSIAVIYGFWISLILGHVFFVTVIRESVSRKKPFPDEEEEGVNLLDDVLNE